MSGWERWSIANCSRDLILPPNSTCTIKNLSESMRYEIFWNFEIQTDHLILARRPVLVIINKQTKKQKQKQKKPPKNKLADHAFPADHKMKTKDSRKLWNMRVTVIPVIIRVCGTVPKVSKKTEGGVGDQRKKQDHPDYSIVKIG